MPAKKLRPLAVYLPQFHAIPENDRWWGKGFTEWTNTRKAVPRFDGHYQPHEPGELGYYDLLNHDTMVQQAALAQQYGLHGFCFYHYWFNGKRLLHHPLDTMLLSKTPDFPFCLCWANENWTRRWDGLDQEVLMKQEYSEADDREHINFLAMFFRDPRYIRVEDKPVFIVYRPSLFPDMAATAQCWREECRKNGVGEIYLMYMQAFGNRKNPEEMGFDAAVEFQPAFGAFPPAIGTQQKSLLRRILTPEPKIISSAEGDQIFHYEAIVSNMKRRAAFPYKYYPGVFPMWDNVARRSSNATIVHGSTPKLYGEWLRHVVQNFQPYSEDENFIFINAWNEWAEGNHLEPCLKWGRAYLEATKKALDA